MMKPVYPPTTSLRGVIHEELISHSAFNAENFMKIESEMTRQLIKK
jgi:hypothetical protein